jgi:predicted HTH transcriptional regulator
MKADRLKIFISSNQKELSKERKAVKEVIQSTPSLRDCFDVFLFEDLPARKGAPRSAYLKEVSSSDIYLGIIGNEYGIAGKDSLSATEREFRYFIKSISGKPQTGKDVLIFIKGKDDSERDQRSNLFIKRVRELCVYKRFINAENLKSQVLASLISCLDERGRISKVAFDYAVCQEADYQSIDEKAVRDYLQNRAVKLKVDIPKISIKDFLLKTLKVLKMEDSRLRPTNAGLLFFGKDPSYFIPQNEIRIARFKGITREVFLDSKNITGPFYKMLDEVEMFFERNTRLASKIVEFKRVDIPEYPYEAIREAAINALAHRDYSNRWAPIMFSIFDDRVEISNPGGLLPGLNIKKLEGHHAARNKVICDIFHETRDMEKFGTGIAKMKRIMKEKGLTEPKFAEEGDYFIVRFYGPGEKILDLVPSIPKERQLDLRGVGLNERQIEALRLMVNEGKFFTNRKYRGVFKVTNKTAATDLKFLVEKGLAQIKGSGRNVEYHAKGLHDSA